MTILFTLRYSLLTTVCVHRHFLSLTRLKQKLVYINSNDSYDFLLIIGPDTTVYVRSRAGALKQAVLWMSVGGITAFVHHMRSNQHFLQHFNAAPSIQSADF